MSFTGLVFAALFSCTLIMALIRHPIFGLYAYLLAFYGYPPERWWGEGLPDLRWSLIAAGVTLIGTLRLERNPDQAKWYNNSAAILLIVFTVWLWIQMNWALSPDDHSFFTTLYTKYLVLFYLLYRIVSDEKTVFHFSLAHVVGCAYYGWLAYSTARGGRFENIGGPGVDGASAFAAHMSTGLIFAGVLLFRTRGFVRIMVLLAIPFILNAIILTQSRGGFLGLMAGGLVVLYLWPPEYRKRTYMSATMGVILFFILAHDVFLDRMATIMNAVEREEMDTSAEARWELIDAQWKMFRLRPVLGSGHRGTVILSEQYLDDKWMSSQGGRSSHNTSMTVLVEQGIPGTIIYIVLAAWAAIRLRKLKSWDSRDPPTSLGLHRAAIGGALTSILVAGQFADYIKLEVTIWCIVLLVVISRLTKDAISNESDVATVRSEIGVRNKATVSRKQSAI